MPNQVEPGTMGGAPPEAVGSGGSPAGALAQPGPTGEHEAFHGRPVSWVAVTFIIAGFVAGGLSIVFAAWPTFWVGVGLAAIGGLLAAFTNIFEDWY
jgi:hypothetical protein